MAFAIEKYKIERIQQETVDSDRRIVPENGIVP
jgi:hypothetical protein